MQIYYLLPIVLIIAVVAYSLYARKAALKAAENMSPEEAAQKFTEFWGQYFDLGPAEQLAGVWSGVEFHAPKSLGEKVGGVAKEAALNVVGVSTYIPTVQIGLTAERKVLVSREYSEMGDRGNFKQILSFDAGTRAVDAATAYPGEDLGKVPKNPSNPVVGLEFVQLRAPDGEGYDAWLSPQGLLVGQAGFHSILRHLK